MNQKGYIRIVDGADTAVLFIHGIAGTPEQFKDLLPLVPPEWSICNLLLDGHGKAPRDFAKTSMVKWEAQVSDAVDRLLATHDRLLLVGHSMGTLHSLQQVLDHPGQIDGLFLEAVPLYCRVKPAMSWKTFFAAMGWYRPGSKTAQIIDYTSIHILPRKLAYFGWLPRFLELLEKSRRTRKALLDVHVPCRCIQSRHDELVSRRSLKALLKHPGFQVDELPNSSHFAYSPEDLETLKAHFQSFLARYQ